jgi:predicted tellurium resistance membrane protein TerC
LALAILGFLLLIGVNLIAEGLGFHIPRGYTYFAMAFSLFVEMLNLKIRSRKPAVQVQQSRRLQKAINRIKAPH